MERVDCNCAGCDQRLGQFFNIWTKIGKSYISPIIGDGDNLRAPKSGPIRLGEEQTLIEQCHLQDVSCLHCRATIGLRCLDTPVNHVLHNGQLFLRLSSVKIIATNGDDPVQLTIQRTLKLKEASRSSSTGTNMPPGSQSGPHTFTGNKGPSEIREQLLDHLQAQLDAQREEIQRLNRSGFQMASSFDNAVMRVEGDLKKLRESMEGLQDDLKTHHSMTTSTKDDVTLLRYDIDEVKSALQVNSSYSNIEVELALAKQAVEDVRLSLCGYLDKSAEEKQAHETVISDLESVSRDLNHFREELEETKKITAESISKANTSAEEVVGLRAEVKALREELAQERSQKSPPADPEFPSREIDILTSNITKIGQKANQVDSLQMEFELFKERLQRIEKSRTSNSQDTADVETQPRNSIQFPPGGSRHKRKHSPQREVNANLDTPSALSSSKRQTRAPLSSSPPSIQVHKSKGEASESPRLTKSGKIDKRFLKGRPRRDSRLAAVHDTIPDG
ncbi:hypothetical protein F5Y05DRAFT_408248 [Hypoxylon sp. FL0543]|nr:hypothetical protein F5Y05DRAFT_408248 [Hypoxylon sp. FL0543]